MLLGGLYINKFLLYREFFCPGNHLPLFSRLLSSYVSARTERKAGFLLSGHVIDECRRIVGRRGEKVFAAVSKGAGSGVSGGRDIKKIIGIALLKGGYVDLREQNL